MTPFHLNITTPEKVFYDGDAEQIVLRTTEGDIGILAHHEQYVANLPAGPVKISMDGAEKLAALSSGVLKVSKDKVTILALAIEWADEIDLEWAKRSEQSALEKKRISKSESEMRHAELKLQRALNRIRVSSMGKG